jgi:hypothetical protein
LTLYSKIYTATRRKKSGQPTRGQYIQYVRTADLESTEKRKEYLTCQCTASKEGKESNIITACLQLASRENKGINSVHLAGKVRSVIFTPICVELAGKIKRVLLSLPVYS